MLKGQTIVPQVSCPFCGGIKLKVKHGTNWGYFVACACKAVGPSAQTPDDAVLRWDHRVVQTSLDMIPGGGGMNEQ